jgi:hypothetical protein
MDEESGTITVNLTESYDNFMPVVYAGGSLALDMTAFSMAMGDEVPEGALFFAQIAIHDFMPGRGYQGVLTLGGAEITVNATNGTWTPPTE